MFAYLVLYIFPFPMDGRPTEAYANLWKELVPRVGKSVFDAKFTMHPTGSGDTAYDYVRVFCIAVLAAATAAVWTISTFGARPTRHSTGGCGFTCATISPRS